METRKFAVLAAVLVAVFLAASPARAASGLPSEEGRDILIISTLLRFNDANLSGNYSVLRDRASRQFREQNSLSKVSGAFKVFRDLSINLEEVITRDIQPDEDGETAHGGILRLSGFMDLSQYRMKYELRYVNDRGEWKLLSINVDVKS
jgi:hypothetical protein